MRMGLSLALLCVAAPAMAAPPVCKTDGTLSLAAAELLFDGELPDQQQLGLAVRQSGSDAVSVKALWVPNGEPKRLRVWLEKLRASADAPLHCGEAVSENGKLVMATAKAGGLDPLGVDSTAVRGWLAPGFERAELVVADAEGQLQRLPLTAAALRDGVPIDTSLARPARVQLLARGEHGPRPVAERILPADESDPAVGADAPAAAATGGAKFDPLAALTHMRQHHRLHALRSNQLLTKVAKRHARKVCKSGRVAHEVVPGQDPTARLLSAGVAARVVGETIARAANARAAFDSVQRSPSHRMTLLDKRFTEVGAASVKRADRTCLVILLASWPRFVGR